MKHLLMLSLLLLSAVTRAADVSLLAGVCDGSNDYCPENIGKIEIGHDIVARNGHALRVEVEHLSGITVPDHGSNYLLIGYKYTFGGRDCR